MSIQYPRPLTRDFERPAHRFHNAAHPFERLGHRRIVEQAGWFHIHDHRAVFRQQQIVGNDDESSRRVARTT